MCCINTKTYGPFLHRLERMASSNPSIVNLALTLAFILIYHTSNTVASSPASPATPVTFRQVGRVIFSGRSFIVPLQLNVQDLVELTNPLLRGLLETKDHYDRLVSYIGDAARGDPAHEFSINLFPNSMQDHIALLLQDLHTRTADLRNLLTTLGNFGRKAAEPLALRSSRIRRAPFEFIGTAANYLFGLTDYSSFKSAQEIIHQLTDLTEAERLQLNIHNDILNVTSLHINKLEKNQNKTIKAILDLDANVRALNITLFKSVNTLFDV